MRFKDCEPRKLFARDVVSYSDAELDRYLEEHTLENGTKIVDVEDPENLPESFINRLRDRAQRPTERAKSQFIDLDQVTVRLLQLPADPSISPRPPSPSSEHESLVTLPPSPTSEEEVERRDYHSLISDGGRPCYPISLLEDVANDPEAYSERLRPWLEYEDADPPQWKVFRRQLGSWQMFREWQQFNRDDFRGWYDCVFSELKLAYNSFDRSYRSDTGFRGYSEAMKNLLAQYGFTRPFEFLKDSKQQDQLTTWIEYLGFEYARYDKYNKTVQRLQPTFDKAWKTLLHSKVLRPSETQEYICDPESAIERQTERRQAWRAMEAAKSAAEKALVPVQKNNNSLRGLHLTPSERKQMLAATSRLDKAKALHKSIMKRNQTITNFNVTTRDYKIAKRKAERHPILLRWILDQVPLIAAEMDKSSAVNAGPKVVRGMKRRLGHDTSEVNTRHPNILRAIVSGKHRKPARRDGANALRRSTRLRQPASVSISAPTPSQKLVRPQILTATVNTACDSSTQARKASRWSRRLAGLAPEP
ncbi:hypothetical protein F5Y09DRAFT_336517 [Xylaria sp. FL1042]|nr:hypothetical protein F5Y09DRAFT_336517 [Xylaria sp. FL1042]